MKKGARGSKPLLLVGRGARPRRVGAVLVALSEVRRTAGSSDGVESRTPLGIGDLEELLAERPENGTLILEADTVPVEDIGFVRRFLERHSGWRLLVVGDAPTPSAAGLLDLGQARWLAWPPDLDILEGILDEFDARTPAANPSTGAKAGKTESKKRKSSTKKAPAGTFDLGALLEERLTGTALSGQAARVRLDRGGPLPTQADRNLLSRGLDGFLAVARLCAGEDGSVHASTAHDAKAGTGRIEIDFPSGPLTDGDLPGLFEGPFQGDPTLAESVGLARGLVEELQGLGARIELAPHETGRVRIQLDLPLRPTPVGAGSSRSASGKGARNGAEEAGESGGDRGRPADPFA